MIYYGGKGNKNNQFLIMRLLSRCIINYYASKLPYPCYFQTAVIYLFAVLIKKSFPIILLNFSLQFFSSNYILCFRKIQNNTNMFFKNKMVLLIYYIE